MVLGTFCTLLEVLARRSLLSIENERQKGPRTRGPNTAASRRVAVNPNRLPLSRLQSLKRGGPRELNVRPRRCHEVVVPVMPHDLRIAPIRLPERIGESGSGRNLRQRRERRCEQAREEHRAGREQRLQPLPSGLMYRLQRTSELFAPASH